MILIADTETTSFANDREGPGHPSQPHIVQLAAQLCEDGGAVIAGFSLIIDPGVEIPEGAAKVHGITTARAVQLGVSPEFALSAFTHLYQRSSMVVFHNSAFDKLVIEAAIFRHYKRVMPLRRQVFCTMTAATPILNLPPSDRMKAAGFDKPKPPRLAECIKFFFNEDLEGAHDAMNDTIACRRIFFELKRLGHVPDVSREASQ